MALSSRSSGIFSGKEQLTINLLSEFLYVRHFNFLRMIRSRSPILFLIDSNSVLLSLLQLRFTAACHGSCSYVCAGEVYGGGGRGTRQGWGGRAPWIH